MKNNHLDKPYKQYEERIIELLGILGLAGKDLYAIMGEHNSDYITLDSDEWKITLEKK